MVLGATISGVWHCVVHWATLAGEFVLPNHPAPFVHWVHYFEAIAGLNAISSVYRRMADDDMGWIDSFLAETKEWVIRSLGSFGARYMDAVNAIVAETRERHKADTDRLRDFCTNLSFSIALVALFLIYLVAIRPDDLIAPWAQIIMAVALAIPLPFAIFFRFGLHCSVSHRLRKRLRKVRQFEKAQQKAARSELWAMRMQSYSSIFSFFAAQFRGSAERHRKKNDDISDKLLD